MARVLDFRVLKGFEWLQQPSLKSIAVGLPAQASGISDVSETVKGNTEHMSWQVEPGLPTSSKDWPAFRDALNAIELPSMPVDDTYKILTNEQTASVLYYRYSIAPVVDLLNALLKMKGLGDQYRFSDGAEVADAIYQTGTRVDYSIHLYKRYQTIRNHVNELHQKDTEEHPARMQGGAAGSSRKLRPKDHLVPLFHMLSSTRLQEHHAGIALNVEMKTSRALRLENVLRSLKLNTSTPLHTFSNDDVDKILRQITFYARLHNTRTHFVSTFRETLGCHFEEGELDDTIQRAAYFDCAEGTPSDSRVIMAYYAWTYAKANIPGF